MLTHILNGSTLRALEAQKKALESNPEFVNGLRVNLLKVLESEANVHSREMERTNPTETQQKTENGLKHAVEWASANVGSQLTTSAIMGLARLIEPENIRYRQNFAAAKDIDHAYPNPVKIPELMEAVVTDLNNDKVNPVDKALYAHLHICRVHPFADGNGRLSRLVQNILLERAGFPPSTILSGEKTVYLDLLHAAQEAYKQRDEFSPISQQEALFYSFLASKINISFEKLKELLASQQRYEFSLDTGKNKGIAFTAERKVKSYLKRRNLSASARLGPDDKSLLIVGSVDAKVVEGLLEGVAGLKYRPR